MCIWVGSFAFVGGHLGSSRKGNWVVCPEEQFLVLGVVVCVRLSQGEFRFPGGLAVGTRWSEMDTVVVAVVAMRVSSNPTSLGRFVLVGGFVVDSFSHGFRVTFVISGQW